MPKLLPSVDRPSANRVRTGSALVTAVLTRGLGVSRSAGPLGAVTAGDSGNPPKVGRGADEPIEPPPGGRELPCDDPIEDPPDGSGLPNDDPPNDPLGPGEL